MFHKRCDAEIEFLREELRASRDRIEHLENEVLVSVNRPGLPVGKPKPGNVYYMDDARLVELEENGDAPT